MEELCKAYLHLAQSITEENQNDEIAFHIATLTGRAANFMKIFIPLEVLVCF
jgi:hypothetical protein